MRHPRVMPEIVTVLGLLLGARPAPARILQVGPGKTYAKPSLAAAAVVKGDTVEIAPGVYSGDVATWNPDNLVLRATAKYAHMKADGAQAGGKGTWVLYGTNTTVENIEFSGAKVPDENGAGIRADGNGLTVRNCYFHDNENGILGGGDANSVVVIENSEFAHNGLGDGYTHNLYIDNVASFTFKHCYSHHAKIGHLVKSRAKVNHILYNRIMDEAEGTSSYQINLPNGGTSYIIGNTIQQGPKNDNPILIAYGEEGMSNPGKDLYVINNTLVNDAGSGTFVDPSSGTLKMWNNLLVGPGKAHQGSADTSKNLVTSSPGFVDMAKYDYRLAAGSPAIDKGVDPGKAGSYSLVPAFQYLDNASGLARTAVGAPDIGAFEFNPSGKVKTKPGRMGRAGEGNLRFLRPVGVAIPGVDALARESPKRAGGVYWVMGGAALP